MRSRFFIWLAAGLMLAPVATYAQTAVAPSETKVAVGDLIGLDPAAVRARMADLPAAWAMAEPILTLAADQGIVSVVSSFNLTEDPAEALSLEHFNGGDESYRMPPHLECKTFVGQPQSDGEVDLTLVFTGGRLSAVYRDLPAQPPVSIVGKTDAKPFQAQMTAPRPSVFIAAPGQLPLADADAFIGRWPKQRLAPDVALTTRCASWQAPVLPTAKSNGYLNASGDIALAPLAVMVPPVNSAREAARENGRTVLAQLKIGAVLVQGLDHFAATTSGVRVFREPNSDYAVMTLDMGARPSHHVDNTDDVAMIGVRSDKVVWIMPSGWRGRALGLTADLLCLDEHSVPGKVRSGCTAYGIYKP
jgi:hypothetical protein